MQARKRPYIEQQDFDLELYQAQPPKLKRRLQTPSELSYSVPSAYGGWPQEHYPPSMGAVAPQPATMAPSCMHLGGTLISEDFHKTSELQKHDDDIEAIFPLLASTSSNPQINEKIDQMNQDLLPLQSHVGQTIEPRPRFMNEPWPSFDTSQMQPPPSRRYSNSHIPNSTSYSQVPDSASAQVYRPDHLNTMFPAGKAFSEGANRAMAIDSGYGSNVVSPFTPSVLSSHGDPTCPSIFSRDYGNQPPDCQSLTNGIDGLDVTSQVFDPSQFDFFADSNGQFGSQAPPNLLHMDQKVSTGPPWICDICDIGQLKNKSEYKKHMLRHNKPFKCDFIGCNKTDGFSTRNDLDRHRKSLHKVAPRSSTDKTYKCRAPKCSKPHKIWPRADNFKQHCSRIHKELNQEELISDSVYPRPKQPEEAVVSERDDSTNLDAIASDERSSSSSSSSNLLLTSLKPESSPSSDPPASSFVHSKTLKIQHIASKVRAPYPERALQEAHEAQDTASHSQLPLSKYQIHDRQTQPISSHGTWNVSVERNLITTEAQSYPNNPPQSRSRKSTKSPSSDAKGPALSQESTMRVPASAIQFQTLAKVSERQDTKQALLAHKSSNQANTSMKPSANLLKTHPLIAAEARRMARIFFNPNLITNIQKWSSQEVEAQIRTCLHSSFLKIILQDRAKRTNPSLNVNRGRIVPLDLSQCPICFKVIKTPSDLRYVLPSIRQTKLEQLYNTSHLFPILRLRTRKHMQRHDRPYTCTAHETHASQQMCTKTFGSKSDWKRHERTMHEDVSLSEAWWCYLPFRPPSPPSDSVKNNDDTGSDCARSIEIADDSSSGEKSIDDITKIRPSENRSRERRASQKSPAPGEWNRCIEPDIPNADLCQHAFYTKDDFYEHLFVIHKFERPDPPSTWLPARSSKSNSPIATSSPTNHQPHTPFGLQHSPTPPSRPVYSRRSKQAKGECKDAKHKAHIGHNGIDGFWCGYCNAVIQIDRKLRGPQAWEERYRHIDETHFRQKGKGPRELALKRNGERGFAWVVLGMGKTKGKILQEEADKARERREKGRLDDEEEDGEEDNVEKEEATGDDAYGNENDAQDASEEALQSTAIFQEEGRTSSPSHLPNGIEGVDMEIDGYDLDEGILDASKEDIGNVDTDFLNPRASAPNILSDTGQKRDWRRWHCCKCQSSSKRWHDRCPGTVSGCDHKRCAYCDVS